jgi:hypothetical protein
MNTGNREKEREGERREINNYVNEIKVRICMLRPINIRDVMMC